MVLWNRTLHAANAVRQQILHIWSSPGSFGAKIVTAFSLKLLFFTFWYFRLRLRNELKIIQIACDSQERFQEGWF